MESERKVSFPNEMLDEMEIEGTIFPNVESDVGIANLSHQEGTTYILRIYQILFNEDTQVYEPVQELAAFSFHDRMELKEFVSQLPTLNGIEMLLMLNPITPANQLN